MILFGSDYVKSFGKYFSSNKLVLFVSTSLILYVDDLIKTVVS